MTQSPVPPVETARKKGVARRVLIALGTIAVGQGLTSGITLASVPILLAAWGERTYGEWLILFAIPAYLILSDLGISAVAGTEMTMRVARHDQAGAARLFSTVLAAVVALSAVVVAVAVLSVVSLPLRGLFDIEDLGERDVRIILGFFVAQVAVTLQSATLEAAFRAAGRFSTGALCRQLVRIAEVSCVPVAAILGASPMVAAACLAVVAAVGSTATWIVLLRVAPWLKPSVKAVHWSELRPIWRPALAFAAVPLATAISLQGMVLVVGGTLGPVGVVVFQTARTLSRLPQGLMYAINQSVWPEVSSAFGAGDIDTVRSLHRRAVQGAIGLALLAFLVLLPLGPPLIKLWTDGKVDAGYALFGALTATVGLNSLWYTSSVVLAATNRHARMAMLNLAGSVLALAVAFVLLPRTGTWAAGMSLLIIDLLMIGYVVPHSLRLSQDRTGAFLRSLVRRI